MSDDFGGTTAVIVWARKRITPKVLWSAIGALLTCLLGLATWLSTTQSDMRTAQHDIQRANETAAEAKKSVADMQQKLDILQDMKTSLAVMASKIDNIDAEVTRQRQRWDRVEEVADSPPHAARRKR